MWGVSRTGCLRIIGGGSDSRSGGRSVLYAWLADRATSAFMRVVRKAVGRRGVERDAAVRAIIIRLFLLLPSLVLLHQL